LYISTVSVFLSRFLLVCISGIFALLSILGFSIFFFSSRRRHTRFKCDWSSDVCSSDLALRCSGVLVFVRAMVGIPSSVWAVDARSEERRVGKECRYRWGPYQKKTTKDSGESYNIRRET